MSERFHTAWWEIREDDDDPGNPYWYGYCEGDKDGDHIPKGKPVVMSPRHFPVGTRFDVQEPEAPEFYERIFDDRIEQHAKGESEIVKAVRKALGCSPCVWGLVDPDELCQAVLKANADIRKAVDG